MTKYGKCKGCGKELVGMNIGFACTCGSFCSRYCQEKYHRNHKKGKEEKT